MAERRHRVRSRGRSPSPRRPPPPRPHDFSPSKRRKYSPYNHHRGRGKFSRQAVTPRRIEKRDNFDREFSLRAPRVSEHGNRDRDRHLVGDRRRRSPPRIRSPRRIEKRDEIDRDNNTSRNVRLPDYEDAGKGKYKDGFDAGGSVRPYDEGSYKWDHPLDGPRKFDHLGKDYGEPHDYNAVGDNNNTGGAGKRDYYPGSHYLDSGRDGPSTVSQYSDSTRCVELKYEREDRMHSRSYTLHHGNDIIPLSNLNGGDGSNHMPSVSSCYLNTDTDKLGYARLRDETHLEKRDGRLHDQGDRYFDKKKDGFRYQDEFLGVGRREEETYSFKSKDNLLPSRGYASGDSHYMVSSSQPRDYLPLPSVNLREGFPGYSPTRDHNKPSHLSQQGVGLTSQPIGYDGYKEKTENMLPRGLGGQFDDTMNTPRLYRRPEEKQGDQLFSEFGRSNSMSTRRFDVEEGNRHPDMSRSIFNPAVDECFHKKPMRDDRQWDPYSYFQARSTPDDKLDASRSLRARNKEADMFGTGGSRLNYGYGSFKKEEHHTTVDGGQWSHVERSDILQSRTYDPPFGRFFDSPRNTSGLVDLSLDAPFDRRLRNKHVMDEVMYEQDVGIRIAADGNGARKIYNRVNMKDELEFRKFSREPKSSRANYKETWRGLGHMDNDRPTPSKFHPSKKLGSRDIKKRLGPLPRKLHVSQRLVKKYKPSIKKRLAPAPPKKHASLPRIQNLSSKVTTSIRDSDGTPRDREGGHSEDHLPPAKPEPPEGSEDFKQLVQSAFFKFLKQINDTPAKRKKYLEQGKAGSLKCVVCGSNSEEFAETESLAMHAFTSKKVGLRSQHLGFHKALCALMGWKIAEELTSEWHCDLMSNAETSALKEDLVIWPPVVIIYNNTIDNKNPDQRVVISTEKLDMKLRDMGFGSIVKVCHGKSANQSVMLVKFHGTLSGLQEAERYHNRYLASKRGRDELKQSKSKNEMSTQVISADREEDILYGHLGIAEDLDKLDFDTKKRCVFRSKKDILSIVNAPLPDEGENVCA